MYLIKKVTTAFHVLKARGFKGVYQIIQAKLDRAYRPDENQLVYQVLTHRQPNGVMIDVGAHHGSALAPFAEAQWQVYAFEPDSHNRSVLCESFGHFPNVFIDPRACSDQVQRKAVLFASEESTGVSGLSAFLDSHKPTENVSVTTLAQAMDEFGLIKQPIDFLKVDTEGFDLKVLQGYPWQNAHHPQVILCEFEDAKTKLLGYDFHSLADYLLDQGYQLVISEWYPIKAYGNLHQWRRFCIYPCLLEDPNGWGNILAVKNQALFNALCDLCQL